MSQSYPGRFNTAAIGAVYLAREPETAIEELRRRAARDGVALTHMHPRSMFVIDLNLHEVVDLTTPGHLDLGGLTPDDLGSDVMVRCQEVAAVAAALASKGFGGNQ